MIVDFFFGTLFCLVIWHLVRSIWSHSLKTPWVFDIEKTAQVPIEVRQMRRAVHQFGLVGGEDYDSKVFNRANPFTVSPRLTFSFSGKFPGEEDKGCAHH